MYNVHLMYIIMYIDKKVMYNDKKASVGSTLRKLENLRTIPYSQITDHVSLLAVMFSTVNIFYHQLT